MSLGEGSLSDAVDSPCMPPSGVYHQLEPAEKGLYSGWQFPAEVPSPVDFGPPTADLNGLQSNTPFCSPSQWPYSHPQKADVNGVPKKKKLGNKADGRRPSSPNFGTITTFCDLYNYSDAGQVGNYSPWGFTPKSEVTSEQSHVGFGGPYPPDSNCIQSPNSSSQYCVQYSTQWLHRIHTGGGVKKRKTANKKERRRTQSINNAFSALRDCLPNVPRDTKLPKIKIIKLAISYIDLLSCVAYGGEQKKRELEENFGVSCVEKKKGRTGWPQQVWESDLKPP